MKVFSKILAGLIPLAFTGGVSAALIGVSGDGAIINAPGSVEDDATNCTNHLAETCVMLGFDEKQDVTLGSELFVDGGSIAAGTKVSSHMIFLNTPGNTLNESVASWLFDGLILGVMSNNSGTLEAASNAELGADSTTYPGAFNNRGFEGNNSDTYSIFGSSLDVTMYVTEPGDWIRVVTSAAEVPEPGTLVLLGTGLLGLFGARKRKA